MIVVINQTAHLSHLSKWYDFFSVCLSVSLSVYLIYLFFLLSFSLPKGLSKAYQTTL